MESLPVNWPKDTKLPTIEECEAAVREGEEMIRASRRARRGKLLPFDAEMNNTIVWVPPVEDR